MSEARLRRSALYLPASNARAIEKARTLDADVLIFDLEDAVAPDAKPTARALALAAVADHRSWDRGGWRPELVLRVNGLDTAWGRDDVAALAAQPTAGGFDAVLLPKVERPSDIKSADALLKSHAGTMVPWPIWAMIETPRGVLDVAAIAAADPRPEVLVVGTNDLAKGLRVPLRPDRQALLPSLGLCVLAARAHGLSVLDGVHMTLEDEAGLAAACTQGVDLGFDGKTLIHPRQIPAANAAFAPDARAIDEARRIIQAHDRALASGSGVAVLDGRLIEGLHAEDARRTLALAAAVVSRDRDQGASAMAPRAPSADGAR